LCKLDEILPEENYFEKPFLIDVFLNSQNRSFSLRPLIDSGSAAHTLIHANLANRVCEKLGIQPIPLAKEKLIRGYDGKISKKAITHKILPNLIIESHKELTVPMLIADIDHHEAILSKLWMNKNGILLNMRNDVIVFPDQLNTPISVFPIPPNSKHPSWPRSTSPSSTIQTKAPIMLKRPVSTTAKEESFSIRSIDAASFKTLLNRSKKNQTEVFALSMTDINREIAYNTQCDLNALNVSSTNETAQDLEDIKAKLPPKYHEFLDVFDRAQSNKLPPHRSYDHKIELTSDSTPSRCRAYRMSPAKLLKVKEYLNENLSKGFITSSQASYSFPVLFALKANEDLRFCVNYRKLNAISKRNRYPLPLIDEIIGKIVGCKHLTRLNIISAFNKLRMHLDSEDYTTFITALGAYKYKMLPFGLTNGPASFQQYMNDVLWNFLNDFCQAYLDDILIYSKTKKKHRDHVKLVLGRLREAELQVNIRKCEFDVEETVFLGVIVSGLGLRMNLSKVTAIVSWITPTNLKEIQSFVRFVNFYRRFIKDFSKLVKPFTQLTRKNTPFVWNDACVQAFDNLKKQVSSAPVLRHFDLKRQAILKIDASNYVKGEILSQYDDEGVLHPVAFYSKSMISAEINYHIYDKELLAIIRCFEHWRPELKCTELLIQMFIDHQALKTFMKNKQLSRRQANYLNVLSEFNFQIIFRSGKMNTKADALTRMPLADASEPAQRLEDRFQTILTPDRVDVLPVEPEANLYQRVRMANQTDELCSEYRQAMNENKLKFHTTKLEDCEIIDGVLFRKGLLWVPENMHTELLQEIHDQPSTSHPGNRRTIDLIQRFYYWPGHRATVRQYIRNCHACQRSKAPRDNINELHHPLLISQERWKDIAMNFITGLPLSEDYNAICTIICRLTKERHYVSCHWEDGGTSAEETVWIMLWNVYRLHGLPSSIVSDRDSQFISTMWKSLCRRLRITASLFTAYHSETDDQSERANQDVERGLRTYCNYMQDDWAKWIPMVEFSDNFNTSSATSMTPFYFNKEFHPRMSFDPDTTDYETTRERLEARKADDIAIRMKELLSFGRQQLEKTKLVTEVQINKHRRDVTYEVGDWVWLSFRNVKTTRLCKDLKDKQLSFYQITAKVGTFYHLRLPVSMKHLHPMFSSKLLRPYSEDPLPEQHSEPLRSITIEDDEHWKVDDILNFRRYRGRIQYKVKWTDLDRDDEWYYVDKGEFDGSEEVLNEFHKLYSNKPR